MKIHFAIDNRIRAALRVASATPHLFAALICATAGPWAANTRAQGSRKDDVVFNSRGQPLSGATIRVCTSAATTTSPCTPTALIYSDVGLTQALANPTTSDGLGNYTFYAAPGRYVIEISGPSITTHQVRDVILPTDPSQPATFSSLSTSGNISGFTLSLAGNLTVAGSAAVTGSLTIGGAPVPSTTQVNTWTATQTFKGPSPWHDVMAFGAKCDGITDDTAAFQATFNAAIADPGGTVYIPFTTTSCVVKSGIVMTQTANWLNVLQVGNITIPAGGSSLLDSATNPAVGGLNYTNTASGGWVFPLKVRARRRVSPNLPRQRSSILQMFRLFICTRMKFASRILTYAAMARQLPDCVDFYTSTSFGMAYIWLVNVNVATATGSTGTPLKVGTLNTQGGFTFNICGGAFFGGNSGATIPATIWLLNTGVVQVGCEAHRMTTEPLRSFNSR